MAKKAPEAAARTRYDRYEFEEVHRTKLIGCPFNPRTISDTARKKLRENLERVGLTHPVVWNKRTGHIVSGHQRVGVIDSLERTDDYLLRVAVVDLSEAEEKEQVVFENNPEAQGDWDLVKLEEIYKDPLVNPEHTGYDVADIYQMFGESPLAKQPEALESLAAQYRALHERHEKLIQNLEGRDDANFYAVVVARDGAELDALAKELCVEFPDADSRFLSAHALLMAFRALRNSAWGAAVNTDPAKASPDPDTKPLVTP
jgi:hypothetical protein